VRPEFDPGSFLHWPVVGQDEKHMMPTPKSVADALIRIVQAMEQNPKGSCLLVLLVAISGVIWRW
jgi:hypothetical protein